MQQKNTAVKIWIADINNNPLIQGDKTNPQGIIIDNQTITRINIIGAIINKTYEGKNKEIQTIEIEDNTGKICARTFEPTKHTKAEIGDCTLIIGKPRTYNNQKYIATEIIKKITDFNWIELRKKQLPALKNEPQTETKQEPQEQETEKILLLIKQKDTGQGADYDEIIKEINKTNAEQILQTMIQTGEIFHTSPTKIKVLE